MRVRARLSNCTRIQASYPGGIPGNSPAFQRWVVAMVELSPEGTADGWGFNRPFGTKPLDAPIPALKLWAILAGPSGTKRRGVR